VPCRRLLPGVYFTQIALHVTTVLSLAFCLLLPLYELFLTVGKYQRPRARQERVGETSTFLSPRCDRCSRIREEQDRPDRRILRAANPERISETARHVSRVTCYETWTEKRGKHPSGESCADFFLGCGVRDVRKAGSELAGSREDSKNSERSRRSSLARCRDELGILAVSAIPLERSSRSEAVQSAGLWQCPRCRPVTWRRTPRSLIGRATLAVRRAAKPRRRGQCVRGANARCAPIRGHSPPA